MQRVAVVPRLKALAKHLGGDVTDGYLHANMAEMYDAACRLPSPFAVAPIQAVATGTSGRTIGAPAEQEACFSGQFDALARTSASKSAANVLASIIGGFLEENSKFSGVSARRDDEN